MKLESSIRESALSIYEGSEGMVAVVFFNGSPDVNLLEKMLIGAVRVNDQTVDNTDCFVVSQDFKGVKTQLYIGKKDFLIHRVSENGEMAAMKLAGEYVPPVSVDYVESHTNIVINAKLTSADFQP